MSTSALIGNLSQEFIIQNKRWKLAQLLLSPFPNFTGSRIRAELLRLFGFHIGESVCFWGLPTIIGQREFYKHLSVGHGCLFNIQCFFDLAADITIENNVVLGPQVMLITGAHHIGDVTFRLGPLTPKPIHIKQGAWLGARCTILPGVTIGEGAVVAAGSVVSKDVAPNTLVGGVPAKIIRALALEESIYQH
ncbi:MAG: acyltransferase [Chloroflexota bacterium]